MRFVCLNYVPLADMQVSILQILPYRNDHFGYLKYSNLCSQLPGGKANVELRNKAMKDRLEHLYAMNAINLQMKDRVAIKEDDDDPFMDEEPEQGKASSNEANIVKKEEEEDGSILVKVEDQQTQHSAYSPQTPDDRHQLRSHINGSPPLSSSPPGNGSPGAFHRHWKDNLVSCIASLVNHMHSLLTLLNMRHDLGQPNYHGR